MSESDSDVRYHIRIKGRVFGPYSIKQLNTLRTRGQFSQTNEISTNGQDWESAASLETLFGTGPKKARSREKDSQPSMDSGGSESNGEGWYYSVDGDQSGPVTLEELRHALEIGRLGAQDMVWKQGMAEWVAATEVPELRQFETFEPAPFKESKKKDRRGIKSTSDGMNEMPSHFLDYVLEGTRQLIGESFVWDSWITAIEVGRYSIYAGILLYVAFCFVFSLQKNDVNIGLLGIAGAVIAIVNQYSGIKSCGAILRLSRATKLRISSMAFLDSIAVLFFFSGIGGLAFAAISWIRVHEVPAVLIGIAFFLICEQLALVALHPKAIGITIADRVGPGEEATSLLSFFLMLPLRTVPAVFGIGTAISVIGVAFGLVMLLMRRPDSIPDPLVLPEIISFTSFGILLYCAAFPLSAYIYFVLASIVTDLIRSILVLPEKLDQLAANQIEELDQNDNLQVSTITNSA